MNSRSRAASRAVFSVAMASIIPKRMPTAVFQSECGILR
jgi:hypothetical protein